jgi:hypothetical protein
MDSNLPDDYLKSLITYVCDTISLKNNLLVIDSINFMCLPEYYKIYILKFAFTKYYKKRINGFENELIYECFKKNSDILIMLLELFIFLNTKNDKYSEKHFITILNIKTKYNIAFYKYDYMNIIDKINNSEVRKNNKLKRILLECELYDELYNNVNNIENIENIDNDDEGTQKEIQKNKEAKRLEFYK